MTDSFLKKNKRQRDKKDCKEKSQHVINVSHQ